MNAKPFFVLLFFGFIIVTFAGGAIGDTDLTPDTPAAAAGEGSPALIQNSVAGSSSPCSSLYAVQSGDTLFAIAQTCSITVADLLAANPQITNANLIQVGQKISIPGGSVTVAKSEPTKAPTPTTKIEPVEPTKTPEPAAITAPPEPTTAATADEIMSAFETARVPGEGDGQSVSAPTPKPTQRSSMLLPGSLVEVSVAGFPPNVPVTVGISQVGKTPFTINESTTDDQGVAKVTVVVPANARRNQMWTVTITTTNTDPKIVATSVPFVVGK